MPTKRRLLSLLPWIVAPLLLAGVLRVAPLDQAWALLRQLSLVELAGLALLNVVVMLTFSGRWWVILRSQGHPIPYGRLAGYRLAAFGVTYFTPGPQFGGEPVQVLLPERHDGVPRSTAVAAVALDKSLELVASFAFLAGGVALMAQNRLLSGEAGRSALAAALVLLVLPALFLLAVWAGGYPLTRLTRAVSWPWQRRRVSTTAAPGRWGRLAGGIEASEHQVMLFCRQHPAALAAAMGMTLLSWLGILAEYWLALWALGIRLTPAQAVMALAAARIALLAALPAGLGALEASQVLIFGALGINPAAGLSLSLLIRLRDTALAAIGLWWGLRLARSARRLPMDSDCVTVGAPAGVLSNGERPSLRRCFPSFKSWTRRLHMVKQTKWVLAALVIIAALVLAACQPVFAPPQSSPAPVGQESDEPVIITLAYNRFLQMSFGPGPAPIDLIRSEVAKKYPNIDVRLNLMPDTINGMREALAVWIAAEDPTVDIYGMDMPWVQEFGRAGWATPLNDALPQLEEDFIANGLDVFSYEGQRLGVPFWSSVSGTFYRTDLLEAAGFEPPKTYDELVTIAQAITAASQNPELSGFVWAGIKDEQLVMTWAEMLLGFGGRYFDDAGQCAMNSPEGVEALSFMVNVIESGVSPREVPAWKADEARTRFAEGNAVFLRHNHDIVVWLDDPERSAVAGKWAVMPNPAQPNGVVANVTGGFALAANPYSDNPTEAMQVLEVIASQPVQKGFAIAWGPVQYYQGVLEDVDVQAANPNAGTIQPLLNNAVPRPPSTRYTELSSILQDELHSAITGIKPAEQALNDACQRIDALEQ